MHQPWRTLAAIINKYLFDKLASNDRLRTSRIDILWEMFYRENVDYPKLIWEDFAFRIDYRQLKKGKRKGSQGEKTAYTPKENADMSEESDSKPARKRTSSRRVIKKKVLISADDNIIPELDIALELGKYMSLTEAAEEEATRQVHATHERIVTEFDPDQARRRPSGIAFSDTSSMSKKLYPDLSQKLKGVLTLTLEEKLDPDTMEALKASKKSIRSQSHVEAQVKELVLNQGFPMSQQSLLQPQVKELGSEQESEYFEEGNDDENIEWVDNDEEEEKNNDDDEKSINLEKTDDEETNDEFVHSEENIQDDDELVHADEQVNDDEDEEMTNDEDADTRNGNEEITDTTKVNAEKTEVVKDDIKKAKLPLTSSSLSVSSGFGNQFLNLSSDTSLIGLATTLLPPPTVSSISHVQLQTTPIPSPPINTETPSVTTILDPLHAIIRSVSVLEKDVQELKEADNTTTLRASLDTEFLPKEVFDFATPVIQSMVKNVLEKTLLPMAQSSSQAPSFLKAGESLSEYELKTIIFDKMDKSFSYLTHEKQQVLFDAL
ncbi:hypothetical protein Tco_0518310 [Tanacetum coccineum]